MFTAPPRPPIIGHRKNGRPIYAIAGADPTTDTTNPTDYLDRLTGEYDTHLEAIEDVVQRAKADGDRMLTEAEDSECKTHQESADKLLPQIERWKQLRVTRQQAVSVRDGAPAAAAPVQRVQITERTTGTPATGDDEDRTDDEQGLRRIHRSAGHFVKDRHLSLNGDPQAGERVQRALAKVLTSDTPGLLPTPFVGDVLGRITAVRPVVNSAAKVPLPASGMQWKRPRITGHTTVDKQTTQKTEVASSKFTVSSLDVSLETLAGAVNMSIQEIERTDPNAVDMVFRDLAAQYGKRSEQSGCDQLVAGTTGSGTVELAADATIDAVRAALFDAAGQIYANTNGEMPNVIYASVDQWARLGAFARQINPQDRDVTARPDSLEVSIAGLRAVVSPALPAGTLKVGITDYLEVTENPGAPVQLRALEVGILGYELGVFGMFAAVVTEAGAFVNLVPPAGV